MKKITSLALLIALAVFPALASAADFEVFPGTGPTGSNVTEAGWTDNHMAGQSFAVPANVTKINRISLSGFKLGHAGGNLGGIVSVALYAGEPTASTEIPTSPEGQSNPYGVNGKTTVIRPTGPMLAREERIFIGGDLANDLASLCGVDQNSIEARFLRRMVITNPERPCPSQSAWNSAYQMLTDQSLRNEWSNWGVPFGSGAIFGESSFDGSSVQDFLNLPSKYTYPNHWSFEGNSLSVTLPNHQVAAGQYFLSIQQSHLDTDRGAEEGGYWEQGRYNCDRPNESRQIDLFGTNTSGANIRLNGTYCGKGNVFVAGLHTENDAYPGGRAYFNTYYYLTEAGTLRYPTGDLANLQIIGEYQAPVPSPSPNLIGPTVTSLQVGNVDSHGFNGVVRSTGRQSAQSGKDWYNPMVVSTTVDQGSGSLKSTYVAFYSSGSSLNQLIQDVNTGIPVPQLQNILNNPSNGVLMAYDARDPKNGVYYVWNPRQTGTNKWVNITGQAGGIRICGPDGCNTDTYFTIFPGNATNDPKQRNLNKENAWTIQFDRNFGSKNMHTTVQAVNSYNLTVTQDLPVSSN